MSEKAPVIHTLRSPEERYGAQILMQGISSGNQPYRGSFNITPDSLKDAMSILFSNNIFGTGSNAIAADSTLGEMIRTGMPTDTSTAVSSLLAATSEAGSRRAEEEMAKASAAGGMPSTTSRAAAVRAGAGVDLQGKAAAAQMALQAQEAARQRQLAAIDMLAKSTAAIRQGVTDVARIQLAANQFKAGMEYEEFKRMFPDVYQLASLLWGKNTDYYVQERQDQTANVLSAIATIVRAVTMAA